MVIASKEPLELNKPQAGGVTINGEYYNQAVIPIRESTYEEWYSDCLKNLGEPPSNFSFPKEYKYFYEIISDIRDNEKR